MARPVERMRIVASAREMSPPGVRLSWQKKPGSGSRLPKPAAVARALRGGLGSWPCLLQTPHCTHSDQDRR